MPYNKQLTNLTCSGPPYWGILADGRLCTDLAALCPYLPRPRAHTSLYGSRARLVRGHSFFINTRSSDFWLSKFALCQPIRSQTRPVVTGSYLFCAIALASCIVVQWDKFLHKELSAIQLQLSTVTSVVQL